MIKKMLAVAVFSFALVASIAVFAPNVSYANGQGSPDACSTNQNTNPNAANVISDDSSPQQITVDVGAGNVGTGVCIKSGSNMFSGNKHSQVLLNGIYENGCYQVTGVGTQFVTVTRLKSGNTCQEISHIDVLFEKKDIQTDPQADLDYIVDCEGNQVKVTLKNSGDAAGTFTVNDADVEVDAFSEEVQYYPNNTTVVIEGAGVDTFDQVVTCGGRGSAEDPKTPTTTSSDPQVTAPKAGVNAGNGSMVAMATVLFASVASIAYGVLRLRKNSL